MTRMFWYESDHPLMLTPGDVEVSRLIAAVCELRNAWREDNGVYSVRVYYAIGRVVTESEAVIAFNDEGKTHERLA